MLLQHQWSETQLTKLVSLDGAYPGPKMSFKLASLLHSGDFNAVFIKIYSVLQLGLKVPGGVGRRGRGLGRTIMEISCIYSPLPPSDDSDARNFIKPRRTSGDDPTWNLSIALEPQTPLEHWTLMMAMLNGDDKKKMMMTFVFHICISVNRIIYLYIR